MMQPPTESFVATFETCLDVANLALASGDKQRAQRALQAAIEAVSDRVDMRRELLATMVRLGNLELEMDAVASARTTFREALAVGEAALGPAALELLPVLKGLASASVSLGALDEARVLVGRATEIADQQPDVAQGAFAELLNDVSRFYFRQGAFGDAEPMLQRLLAIKRVKGEEHPEVATVTASLATTRQALGRYESAEQLWRKVLAIRERTLAPSHFSLATTLEHLADCCAARGKLAEALRLAERALVIREVALGTEHASVRALRERIGDMRLQAAEEAEEATGPLARPSAPALTAVPPAPVVTSVPPALPLTSVPPAPATAALAIAPEAVTPAPVAPDPVAPAAVVLAPVALPAQQFQSVLLDIQRDMEVEETPEQGGFLAVLKQFPTALRERRPAAIVGTSALVVSMAGAVAFGVMQRPSGMQWVVDETARQQGATASTYSVPAPAVPATTPIQDSIAATRTPVPSSATKRPNEERNDKPASRAPASEPNVPTVSRPVMPSFSSVVSTIEVPRTNLEAIPTRDLGADKALSTRTDGKPSMATRAHLIGSMPIPGYPQGLNRTNVGGDVRVRFDVDTLGRPILATFQAVGSPNKLLVDAVRRVVPEMRFDPARSAWPASKPMVDQVELVFTFVPTGQPR